MEGELTQLQARFRQLPFSGLQGNSSQQKNVDSVMSTVNSNQNRRHWSENQLIHSVSVVEAIVAALRADSRAVIFDGSSYEAHITKLSELNDLVDSWCHPDVATELSDLCRSQQDDTEKLKTLITSLGVLMKEVQTKGELVRLAHQEDEAARARASTEMRSLSISCDRLADELKFILQAKELLEAKVAKANRDASIPDVILPCNTGSNVHWKRLYGRDGAGITN